MSNIRTHNKESGVKAGRALLQDRGGAHGVLGAASKGTDPFLCHAGSHGASGGAHPGLCGLDLRISSSFQERAGRGTAGAGGGARSGL